MAQNPCLGTDYGEMPTGREDGYPARVAVPGLVLTRETLHTEEGHNVRRDLECPVLPFYALPVNERNAMTICRSQKGHLLYLKRPFRSYFLQQL